MVEGSGGTSGAHTVIHKACTTLLWDASPNSRRICPALTQEYLHAWCVCIPAWLGRHNHVAKWQLKALLFVFVCRYVYERLKWLKLRLLSHIMTLLFLAMWHGLWPGYFISYLLQFILILQERQVKLQFCCKYMECHCVST